MPLCTWHAVVVTLSLVVDIMTTCFIVCVVGVLVQVSLSADVLSAATPPIERYTSVVVTGFAFAFDFALGFAFGVLDLGRIGSLLCFWVSLCLRHSCFV